MGVGNTSDDWNLAMKLTGQRNQCPGCGLYFASNHAFDKHRVGKYGANVPIAARRRCKTAAELVAEGWNASRGFWRSKSAENGHWARALESADDAHAAVESADD